MDLSGWQAGRSVDSEPGADRQPGSSGAAEGALVTGCHGDCVADAAGRPAHAHLLPPVTCSHRARLTLSLSLPPSPSSCLSRARYRRLLPNGAIQTQTVCCSPSDAVRGVRNLQADLARKVGAATGGGW